MAEGSGTKGLIHCSEKFLVKMKKKCVFYLKAEKNTFWPTQYLIILKGNTFVWSLVLQVHGIVLKKIFSLLHTDQDLGSCLHDARNDSLPTFFEFTKSYFLLDWIYKIFAPCSLLDKSTFTQTCWAKKKLKYFFFVFLRCPRYFSNIALAIL